VADVIRTSPLLVSVAAAAIRSSVEDTTRSRGSGEAACAAKPVLALHKGAAASATFNTRQQQRAVRPVGWQPLDIIEVFPLAPVLPLALCEGTQAILARFNSSKQQGS
jgi:hypothetical protein